jgi:hypothetical protein
LYEEVHKSHPYLWIKQARSPFLFHDISPDFFLSRAGQWMPLVMQELLTLQGYLHLPTGLCRIHVAQSLVFCVVFCESLFVFLSFFVWSLYCLYFGFCLHIWCLQAFLIVNSMKRYHDLWLILEINPVAPSLQCYCQNLLTTTL